MKKQRSTSVSYRRFSAVITVCLLTGILAVNGYAETKAKTDSAEDSPLVRTMVVKSSDTAESYVYSGEVHGRYESQLAFQVGGKIIKRHVDVGNAVKAGQILMEIDQRDVEQAVQTAEAQVNSAEAQRKLAKGDLKRYGDLYSQKLISTEEYDQYKTAADTAEAAVKQANAQLADAKNKIAYCKLASDNAGVVANLAAEVGQVVSAGQTVVTVVRDNEKEIEISVPENRLEDIRNAQQLNVSFWALPDVVDGKVREIAPMPDDVARTYLVRVSMPKPPAGLNLGMTAKVTIADTNARAEIYIPISAIYQTGDTPSVWVVNNGVVNLKAVKIGEFGSEHVQIIEGLKDGDVIVTAGVHKLREGQKVRAGGEQP